MQKGSRKVTFRLGNLDEPLQQWCEENGKTESEAARLALSRLLRVRLEPMSTGGREDVGEMAAMAAQARWAEHNERKVAEERAKYARKKKPTKKKVSRKKKS